MLVTRACATRRLVDLYPGSRKVSSHYIFKSKNIIVRCYILHNMSLGALFHNYNGVYFNFIRLINVLLALNSEISLFCVKIAYYNAINVCTKQLQIAIRSVRASTSINHDTSHLSSEMSRRYYNINKFHINKLHVCRVVGDLIS